MLCHCLAIDTMQVCIQQNNFCEDTQVNIITMILSTFYLGEDYIDSGVMELVFTPSDDSFEIPLRTLDDTLFEENEQFLISLSIPSNPPARLNPSQTASSAVITILDNEGKKTALTIV